MTGWTEIQVDQGRVHDGRGGRRGDCASSVLGARAANQAHLRIMETTDIHVNVLPYDYYADKPNDTMGLSRTASLIDGGAQGSHQRHADRQWRPAAGQPDGRLHRL